MSSGDYGTEVEGRDGSVTLWLYSGGELGVGSHESPFGSAGKEPQEAVVLFEGPREIREFYLAVRRVYERSLRMQGEATT